MTSSKSRLGHLATAAANFAADADAPALIQREYKTRRRQKESGDDVVDKGARDSN